MRLNQNNPCQMIEPGFDAQLLFSNLVNDS